MYATVKRIAKTIIPKKFLLKNERFLRSIFALKYRGNTHKCSVCLKTNSAFIVLESGDLLCPFCGSRSRTRHLFSYLKSKALLQGDVLHFSPSRSLYHAMSTMANINYITTDFEDEFIAQHQYNICNIPHPDNSFDLIICYHILEHIPDDSKAMQELSRILKPNGICLIQTPFKAGATYEDKTIVTPEDRLAHFGQEDHVRIYSIANLQERLHLNGFDTVKINPVVKDEYWGILESQFLEAQSK